VAVPVWWLLAAVVLALARVAWKARS